MEISGKNRLAANGILILSLLLFFSQAALSQFALFGSAGYYKPNGTELGNAMNTSFGFQAGALYTFSKFNFSVGAGFGMQNYKSLDGYFGSGYISEMRLTNLYFITQYHFWKKKTVDAYIGVDAGVSHLKYPWFDTLNSGTIERNDFSAAPNLGANMDLVKGKLALYADLRYQITFTGDFNYGNFFHSSRFDAIGVSLGLKFSFGGKQNVKNSRP